MNNHETNRWSFTTGSVLLILAGLISVNAIAQDEDEATEDEVKKLDKVVITGSRIARTQIEGPAPVIIIDRDQIEREGFTTVEGVLKSLSQANGVVQNEMFGGGFTQNANSIDLRGLGPGRLLILVDGRRASDYPLAFNGQSNIVNISAIPLVAVDRIEVLSSGASAIYGSDAVGGVVNIILRRDLGNSLDMNVRAGGTDDGGMTQSRFQAVGGFLGNRWNVTYAFEYLDRDPLYASQRDFMDSVQDNPAESGRINTRNSVEIDIFGSQIGSSTYVDPGDCDGFSGTSLEYSSRPDPVTGQRFYCGSATWVGEQAMVNQREQANFYTAASLELGDRHELYGSFNVFSLDAEADSNFTFYFNQTPFYIPNSNATGLSNAFGIPGAYVQFQRIFTKAEMGPPENTTDKFGEDVLDYSVGARGEFFSPLWNYDIIYSHSDYELERDRILIVEQAVQDHFFNNFDENLACTDPFGFCWPIAEIDYSTIYAAGSPQLWDSLTDHSPDSAETSNDVITAVISGDLFDMPAGPLGMAALLEWGTQDYEINLDPRLVSADHFWGITGTGGRGDRDRLAAGLEFSIPVHSMLHLSAAVRYDEYDDVTNVDDATTYNGGLEFRPNDKLLIRGSIATSFRAPDMHFVFADPSGFFTFVTDEYLCQRDEPGVPISACTNNSVNIFGERVGNPLLMEEESESYTYGFVFEPTENLSLSVDYWDIELENLVVDNPLSRVLEIEADCRLGRKDLNSGECVDALSRITRHPNDGSLLSEQLIQVNTGPVNAAVQEVSGIDSTFRWRLEGETAGSLIFDFAYSHIIENDFKLFVEDNIESIRTEGTRDWRSRVRGSVTWNFKDFSATLFGERFGSALSADNIRGVPGRDLSPRTIFNLTAGYELMDGQASIALIVNNLFDKKPPNDTSNTSWPYFDIFNYGNFAIGRAIFGQVQYRFDY